MIRKIVKKAKYLRESSTEVKDFSKALKILSDMKDTMIANRGVGLAAIQIGVPKRIIWITTETSGVKNLCHMINPYIVDGDDDLVASYEGCLSFPGKYGNIKRCPSVCVHFQNIKKEWKRVILEGNEAFIVQHEIDHINGIICIDLFENIV